MRHVARGRNTWEAPPASYLRAQRAAMAFVSMRRFRADGELAAGGLGAEPADLLQGRGAVPGLCQMPSLAGH